MIEIKSWLGGVLHRSEKDTLKAALEEAVAADADLADANLADADLAGADLAGANLAGANLAGAKNINSTILETGETFGVYVKDVVPALCVAGGRTLEEVAAGWNCHDWTNCPMAIAFGVHDVEDVPRLYRPRVDQFVRLFDAKLIPCPVDLGGAASCEATGKEPTDTKAGA